MGAFSVRACYQSATSRARDQKTYRYNKYNALVTSSRTNLFLIVAKTSDPRPSDWFGGKDKSEPTISHFTSLAFHISNFTQCTMRRHLDRNMPQFPRYENR